MDQTTKKPDQADKMDFQSRFRFKCHPGVSCFTTCCADVTIFLTPYDVLRLKNRLGIKSDEFMEKYTHLLNKGNQIIPLVVLKMTEDEHKRCPFVTDQGCTVYTDRPWACRMFPLDVDEQEKFSVIAAEEKCKGLLEEDTMRVIEWLEDQGVMDYQRVNNYYSEITTNPKLQEMDVTNEQIRQMFYLASYDLDKFRDYVLGTRFRTMFDFDEDFWEQIRVDDSDLLKLGLDWIKFGLFGQMTLKLKPEVMEAYQKAQKQSS